MQYHPRLVNGAKWRMLHHPNAEFKVIKVDSDGDVWYVAPVNGWSDHAPVWYFLNYWVPIVDMDKELEWL